MARFLIIATLFGFAAYVTFRVHNTLTSTLTKFPTLPKYDQDKYWGPGKIYEKDISVLRVLISFDDHVIEKLKIQLNDTDYLTPPLEDVDDQYGFRTDKLKKIIEYWRGPYLDKWYSEREYYIGKFPQYKTKIQGLEIQYVRVYPKNVSRNIKVIPILLLHGWPGSVLEFYELIPLLTTVKEGQPFVFEVIAPYLPGFGYSDGAHKSGFDVTEIAIVLKNLMDRIDIKKYYIQGGDWGAIIGSRMTTLFPENIIGYHSNMCMNHSPFALFKMLIGSIWPRLVIDKNYVHWYYPLKNQFYKLLEESGYFHLQCTKPDTIGAALNNNPIGLSAYILEKFVRYSNLIGPINEILESNKNLDRLLDNLMIYYATNSSTTAARIYKEMIKNQHMNAIFDSIKTNVPTACAKFKNELRHQPDFVLNDKYVNLIQSNHYDTGGHFAALETPDILFKDIIEFVSKVENKKLN